MILLLVPWLLNLTRECKCFIEMFLTLVVIIDLLYVVLDILEVL